MARAVTEDDVEQELVVAALRAAVTMPLGQPPKQIRRRLTMRATWEVMRMLIGAARKQGAELEGLSASEPDAFEQQKAMFELAELRTGADDDAFLLALQALARGQTFVEMARELGLTPAAARSRCRRAAYRFRNAAA